MFRNFTPLFLPSICRRIKSGVFASSSAVFLLIELSVDRTYFGYSSNFLFVNVILLRSLVEVKVRTFSFIRQSSITLTSMVGMLQITFSLLLCVHSGLNTYRCPVRLLNLSRGCFLPSDHLSKAEEADIFQDHCFFSALRTWNCRTRRQTVFSSCCRNCPHYG